MMGAGNAVAYRNEPFTQLFGRCHGKEEAAAGDEEIDCVRSILGEKKCLEPPLVDRTTKHAGCERKGLLVLCPKAQG